MPEVEPGSRSAVEVFDAGSVRISSTDFGTTWRPEAGARGPCSGAVAEYITKHGLYKPGMPAALKGLSARDKVREGLSAALDRKAAAVLVFNLTELTTMADYFVLSTARNDRQARAIADAHRRKLGPASPSRGTRPPTGS